MLVFFYAKVRLYCALHNAPVVQNSHSVYRDASLCKFICAFRYYGHIVSYKYSLAAPTDKQKCLSFFFAL